MTYLFVWIIRLHRSSLAFPSRPPSDIAASSGDRMELLTSHSSATADHPLFLHPSTFARVARLIHRPPDYRAIRAVALRTDILLAESQLFGLPSLFGHSEAGVRLTT